MFDIGSLYIVAGFPSFVGVLIPLGSVPLVKPCRNCARIARSGLLILAGVALLGFACRPAAGQQREISYDKIDPEEAQKKFEFAVRQILREGKFNAGEEDKFVDYFTLYSLPQWTLKESRAKLADLRKRLHPDLNLAGRVERPSP